MTGRLVLNEALTDTGVSHKELLRKKTAKVAIFLQGQASSRNS
jgi:hypothetical protein